MRMAIVLRARVLGPGHVRRELGPGPMRSLMSYTPSQTRAQRCQQSWFWVHRRSWNENNA